MINLTLIPSSICMPLLLVVPLNVSLTTEAGWFQLKHLTKFMDFLTKISNIISVGLLVLKILTESLQETKKKLRLYRIIMAPLPK
jgi:hypothetical protein